MSHFSIRTLLIISILLPLVIVYAISMTIDVRNSREDALQNVQVQLQSLVGKHAERVDAYFEAVAHIPKTIAATLSADQTPDEEHFESTLREILKTFPRLIGLGIFFEPEETRYVEWYVYRKCTESEEIFFVDEDERKVRRYVVRDWYKNTKETGQAEWSEPYYDVGGSGLPMCTYSIPLFRGSESDRQFIGVVMIDVGLEDLQDIISKISEEDKRYYLLSATGQYVIASHNELDLAMKETIFTAAEKFGKEDLAKAGRDMLADKSGILAYSRVKDDRRVYIAYTPLPKTGWHLKVAMDEDKVLEPVYAKIYYTIFYFLAEFAVILVVVVVVAGRLAVPIKRLAKFARQLAAGDLESHVGSIRLSKEIDQLAHTFDKMVVDLKSNIEQRIKEESARQAVESELVAARRIQASLMPRIFPPFPERKEFDLHAMNEPVVFIAGDFFDFFFIKPDTLAFVIADVSGHGIPAALFMAVSRTILRTFSTPDRSPHEVMEHVNQLLSTDNDDMMFVTMFYGHYNVATGELTYVNAGHDPPYFVRKDGRLEALQATGPLVATFEGVSYKEQTVQMESGDLLVTFTDGVTEAHSRDNVMYGTERLERLLVEIREESVVEICDRVFRDADSFAGHECQDDVTLLVLRRN